MQRQFHAISLKWKKGNFFLLPPSLLMSFTDINPLASVKFTVGHAQCILKLNFFLFLVPMT